MSSISSIASSGMQAAMISMHVSAHNIANSSTPGFQRQGVSLQSQAAGVSAQVMPALEAGSALMTDVVQQMVALYAFKANAVALETGQRMLGSLLDATA